MKNGKAKKVQSLASYAKEHTEFNPRFTVKNLPQSLKDELSSLQGKVPRRTMRAWLQEVHNITLSKTGLNYAFTNGLLGNDNK